MNQINTFNIDQSEHYLAPRARAFTWRTHCDVGDTASCEDYVPIYKGEDFDALWRKLSSTDDNIKNHNSSGINNISIGLTNLFADRMQSSGVCA